MAAVSVKAYYFIIFARHAVVSTYDDGESDQPSSTLAEVDSDYYMFQGFSPTTAAWNSETRYPYNCNAHNLNTSRLR